MESSMRQLFKQSTAAIPLLLSVCLALGFSTPPRRKIFRGRKRRAEQVTTTPTRSPLTAPATPASQDFSREQQPLLATVRHYRSLRRETRMLLWLDTIIER